MNTQEKYLSVRVEKETPIPYGNEEMAPMYRVVFAEQRAYLTGNRHDALATLAYEANEQEAKRKAVAFLRRLASQLETVDRSGGDPRLCSYCGHPANSTTCQRSHP